MGKGTKDLVGKDGLSTEEFIAWVEKHMILAVDNWETSTSQIIKPSKKIRRN